MDGGVFLFIISIAFLFLLLFGAFLEDQDLLDDTVDILFFSRYTFYINAVLCGLWVSYFTFEGIKSPLFAYLMFFVFLYHLMLVVGTVIGVITGIRALWKCNKRDFMKILWW